MTIRSTAITLAWALLLCGCTTSNRIHPGQDQSGPDRNQPDLKSEQTAVSDPGDLAAALRLAEDYGRQKKNDEAIRVLQTAATYHPRSFELWALMGYICRLDGNYEPALKAYRHLVELAPEKSAGYIAMADVYFNLQNEAEAVKWLRKAKRKATDIENLKDMCRRVTEQYVETGQGEKVLECFAILHELDPSDVRATARLFIHQLLAGKGKEARKLIEESQSDATRTDDLLAACEFLGMRLADNGRLPEAVECFDIVHSRKPDDVPTTLRLFGSCLSIGQKARGKRALRAIPDSEKTPRFWSVIAKLYAMTREYEDALNLFDRIERMPPAADETSDPFRDTAYYYNYGSACEREGKPERAMQLLEISIDLDKDNDSALNYLAYMWAERDINLDKALDHIRKALELAPENAAYVDTLGWIHYKRHEYDPALQEIQLAYDMMPDDPTVGNHLGDVFEARNDREQAIVFWKASFILDPSNREVADKLKHCGADMGQLRKEAKAAARERELEIYDEGSN